MSQKIVTINGRRYDAHTGLPLADMPSSPSKTTAQTPIQPETPQAHPHHVQHSRLVHASMQKSQTLNRQAVKNPRAGQAAVKPAVHRSAAISKFGPKTAAQPTAPNGRIMSDIGPRNHPTVAAAHKKMAASVPHHAVKAAPKPSRVIKNEAIKEALHKAPTKKEIARTQPKKKRWSRAFSVASASLAIVLLGGYFTYLNMPSLSVKVAAAQAGVDASYPDYRPDGYSLNGPVAFTDGQVSMKFAANAGPQNYTIDQSKSGWDSSAVLDNYVKKKAGDNYITYNERGLTIYTFDGNAAWVNGGVLYTITGDAPLSSDQIRRIATSM